MTTMPTKSLLAISNKTRFVKRVFNPSSRKDLAVYKNFIQNGTWGPDGCPFVLEFPYAELPVMLSNKIAAHAVRNIKV